MFAIALLAVIGGSFVAIDRMMGPLSGEGGVFIGGVVAATAGPVLITAIFLPQYARLSIFLLFSCSLMLISYRVAAGFAANEPALGIFLGVVMFIWMWLTFGCCWYFFTSTALFGDYQDQAERERAAEQWNVPEELVHGEVNALFPLVEDGMRDERDRGLIVGVIAAIVIAPVGWRMGARHPYNYS